MSDEKPDANDAAAKPIRLFDGRTLAGWRAIGFGEWQVKDLAIVGRNVRGNDYGHLVSDRSFTDFTIRLKFKSVAGNSGLYFRLTEGGAGGVSGFQAEIDSAKDVGGLYETNGRGWVVQPTPEQIETYFKPNEWNDLSVTARGGDIAVAINGKTSAELKADDGKWTTGPFALQVHGGQDVEVWFKDILVQKLD